MSENKELLRIEDINIDDLSPMMKQYVELRKTLGDTVLFYRLGDFYEMFFDDAILISKTLELTLTGRDCGNNMRAPMCGVPFHACSTYTSKLLNQGFKIAICEQLEDPATCKGLVKRGIIQVLTPGTLTDNNGLEDRKNNFLMSIYSVGTQYGVCVADITTGVFEGTQLTTLDNDEHLLNLRSYIMNLFRALMYIRTSSFILRLLLLPRATDTLLLQEPLNVKMKVRVR